MRQHPGIYAVDAFRLAGANKSTGPRHAAHLARAGLIVPQPAKHHVRLFPWHAAGSDDRPHHIAAGDRRLRLLLDWLRQHPDARHTELLDDMETTLGWPPSSTKKRLERLVRLGVIRPVTRDRQRRYALVRPP